jgi:ABC-type transport system substrate-binding protein
VTLEFDLRTDVVFHDGSPLTAADVKFSLERTM